MIEDDIGSVDTEERHTDLRVGLTIISLREGDITEADVDAIVNAANTDLILGAGVAGAIDERGGPEIQKECDALGPIKVGQAVVTTGGKLLARHVIHAVGPQQEDGDVEALLATATHSVMRLATEQGFTSLAIPALSTGVFGVDLAVCARAMLGSLVKFLEHEKTTVRRIEFCLRGPDAMHAFTAELQQLRTAIDLKH